MNELRQKRMTRQKAAVYRVISSTTTHPTAEWIYAETRKELPDISLGTVYRNIRVLLDEGSIIELCYGKGQSHYDATVTPHYHFVCRCCGRILDFPAASAESEAELLSRAPGSVENHRFECYGVCKDCLDGNFVV